MVNSDGTILHKTGHNHGRKHDYEIFKNNHPTTPLEVANLLDLGYLGVQNDFPTVKYLCHLERIGRKVNSQMKKKKIIENIPN